MKVAASLGMPWEDIYGYAQAVQVEETIYLAGQVGHDDQGNVQGDMEIQMRSAYANVEKVLAQHGASIDDVVDETLFVTDMDAAFAARARMKDEIFSAAVRPASTIVEVQRLAFPELMVEIKCIARRSRT